MIYLKLIIYCVEKLCSFFLPYEYPVDPPLSVEKAFLTPTDLSWRLCWKSINHIWVGLFPDSLYVSLIYILIFLAIPNCLDSCRFIVYLEVSSGKSTNYVHFKIHVFIIHIKFITYITVLFILNSLHCHTYLQISFQLLGEKGWNFYRNFVADIASC